MIGLVLLAAAILAAPEPAATPARPAEAPSAGAAPTARAGAGDGTERLFAEGNAAFLSGDPAKAVALYEALLAEGVTSAELETNLGAALERQGRRGAAALHFERALFLAPGDDDARADLQEVRKGNVDRLEGESEDGGAETALRLFSPAQGPWASIALIALWSLAWAALAARLLLPVHSLRVPIGGVAAALFACALVAGGLCAGAAASRRLALQRAVIVSPSTAVREGPDAKSASPFEVHEGTPVRLEDSESGFARIKLGNGLTGWVPRAAVERVVPPRWGGVAQPG
ncbi:MAG: hypothetical protein NVS2B9_17380 [Myxococcales bacterium]